MLIDQLCDLVKSKATLGLLTPGKQQQRVLGTVRKAIFLRGEVVDAPTGENGKIICVSLSTMSHPDRSGTLWRLITFVKRIHVFWQMSVDPRVTAVMWNPMICRKSILVNHPLLCLDFDFTYQSWGDMQASLCQELCHLQSSNILLPRYLFSYFLTLFTQPIPLLTVFENPLLSSLESSVNSDNHFFVDTLNFHTPVSL